MAENKIISYDVELLSTNKRREFYIPEVYTNDLYSNEFQFNILDVPVGDLAGATARILLDMRDGSFFNNSDVTRSGNTFKYVLKANEGKHYGIAKVQLVVVIGGKDYATPLYNFAVMQGLDDKKANEVVINDLNSETRKEIAKLKSETNTIITDLSAQWQQVIDETTGKDIVSAPEIISARNGEADLKTRLDKEKQDLTAQLAQIVNQKDKKIIDITMPPYNAKGDAFYYDEVNKLYYKDETMTKRVTDNKAIFQQAIDDLNAIGGGVIYVPAGTYLFKSKMLWKSNVSLIGDGMKKTHFVVEGYLFNLIENNEGSTDGKNPPSFGYLENCEFENFSVDMQGLTFPYSNTNGKALFILYMKNGRFNNLRLENTIGTALGCDFLIDTSITNIYVYNAGRNWGIPDPENDFTYKSGQSGIGIGTSSDTEEPIVISNCYTYNCGFYGVFVETQGGGNKSLYAKVIGCHSEGNLRGFGNMGSGGTQFIGCTAPNNIEDGFRLHQGARDDQLIGCIADTNGQYGLYIDNTYRGNVQISDYKAMGNALDGIYVGINNNTLRNVTVNNAQLIENGASGLRFGGNTENVIINDVMALNNGQVAEVSASYKSGILLSGKHKGVVITNNITKDNQGTATQLSGIKLSSDVVDFVLDNNIAQGNETKDIDIFAPLSNGKLGKNIGFETVMYGTGSFADGVTAVNVTHYFGGKPTFITLSHKGDSNIWVSASGANQMTVNRTSANTSALDFTWKLEI